jgi:hypothetical protein
MKRPAALADDWNHLWHFNIDHYRADGGTVNFPHPDCVRIKGDMPTDPGENLFAKTRD